MIDLLGAGHSPRPASYLMRKGYRWPWIPQDRKEVFQKYVLDLEGGRVSGGIAQVFEWMIIEFPSISAPVVQLTSPLSLLLVGPLTVTCFPLFLTLEEHYPQVAPPYVNAHEALTRFLHLEDKKRLVRQAGGGN